MQARPPARAGRLVLVANRLPVSVSFSRNELEVRPSAGGLANGLRRLTSERELSWIGWPGAAAPTPELREKLEHELARASIVGVHLSASESQRFYEGMSNGVLWPLFHYLVDQVPRVVRHWDAYVEVNRRFSEVVAAHATEDDLIWIHDYHLLLLPALVRAHLPRARIGFFLHIPFPSSEVFRTLPHREEVLRGLLGADVIGFHSYDYLRHFADSLLALLGLETELDRVEHDERSVRLGVFPMGIDAERFHRLGSDGEVLAEASRVRASQAVDKLLLGVDRLDYTKGLPRKVLAMERLLERSPKFRGRVRLIQIAVPSREHVEAYRTLRRDVEELVGHVNGSHATLHGAPIHYLYRSVSDAQLVASYRAADVMLVTPLRDGMNLVAKEFVAARADGDGVLVLSELAGAASELGEAVTVNPYDVEALADAFDRALTMPENERRERMATLRQKVLSRPVQLWAETFLNTLAETTRRDPGRSDRPATDAELDSIAERFAAAPRVMLALDYDGTLVSLRPSPELARPDAPLLALLAELAKLPGVSVNIVSGRTRDSLAQWLGELPVGLAAEHGFWLRSAQKREWEPAFDPASCTWKPLARAVLDEYALRTPGALVEEKTVGLAWHYRNAAPHLGTLRARELRSHLVQSFAQAPVTILTGRKVIEVRPHGIDKGNVIRKLSDLESAGEIAAFGDDRTDEDLFAALPETAYTFRAGPGATRARYRVNGPPEVRFFLNRFLELRKKRV